jgi:mRNA-degrading endonuclease RelE of RelBE toxin-antitoxin system
MEFRIADTFTDSLARLTGEEQKAVKTTAFDLQVNPAHPSLSLHKLDGARDKNFWSVRVSQDIRLIVHKTEDSLLMCYVDHHDEAYRWAERRKLETHPKTGAAQLVEIRETVREIEVPVHVAAPKPLLFAHLSDDELLGYGALLGRKTRLPEQQRHVLWSIFERVRAEFQPGALVTNAQIFTRLASMYAEGAPPPYDFAVVDEAQYISDSQLRFLALWEAGAEIASSLPATWASASSSSRSPGSR